MEKKSFWGTIRNGHNVPRQIDFSKIQGCRTTPKNQKLCVNSSKNYAFSIVRMNRRASETCASKKRMFTIICKGVVTRRTPNACFTHVLNDNTMKHIVNISIVVSIVGFVRSNFNSRRFNSRSLFQFS